MVGIARTVSPSIVKASRCASSARHSNSWEDDEAIRTDFYGEVVSFLKDQVGANRVAVFDHTIRAKRNEKQQTAETTTTQRAPVMLVHCDYTPNSGPLRVRQLLPGEADDLVSTGRLLQFLEAAATPCRGTPRLPCATSHRPATMIL